MKTVNRGWLLRKAKAGKLVLTSSYKFDDQYGEDRSNNQELPVRVSEVKDFVTGFCNLTDWHFQSSSGGAYHNDNGTIHLRVHSDQSFNFKLID